MNYSGVFVSVLFLASVDITDTAWGAQQAQETSIEVQGEQAALPVKLVDERDCTLCSAEDIQDNLLTGDQIVIDASDQSYFVLSDPGTFLQTRIWAFGPQIDRSRNGQIFENGSGSQTLNMRGLGADRNQLRLNGVRLIGSGAEGAPANASLNLLPASLIESFSVTSHDVTVKFGTGAVAGVVDLNLRRDFDGLEAQIFGDYAEHGAGDDVVATLTWGSEESSRGMRHGIGVEYSRLDEVTEADRPYTAQCDRHYEVDEEGQVHTLEALSDVENLTGISIPRSICKLGRTVGSVRIPWNQDFFSNNFQPSSLYYTGAHSTSQVPGFSQPYLIGPIFGNPRIPLDLDGDGVIDVDYHDYSATSAVHYTTLSQGNEKFSFYAYADQDLDWFNGTHLKSNFLATYATSKITGQPAQLFPNAPAHNPFNICNPNGVSGVDCGLALDAIIQDQRVIDLMNEVFYYPYSPSQLIGPIGPIPTQPVVSVSGDRNVKNVTLAQFLAHTQLTGAFEGPYQNEIRFVIEGSYSESKGQSKLEGIRSDKLNLSLASAIEDPLNPGTFICGEDANNDGRPDGTDGCVPINMFAPSLYAGIIGDFATQAERDYLFDTRRVETHNKEFTFNTALNTNVFALPAGPVVFGAGVEWRYQSVNTHPDEIAQNNLFFAFSDEMPSKGEKWTRDLTASLNAPISRGISLELAIRSSDDEYVGENLSHLVAIDVHPIPNLTFRAQAGTSWRNPNLRENFLGGTSGFGTIFDPCSLEFIGTGGVYDPLSDSRSPYIKETCANLGIDPSILISVPQSYSVQLSNAGSTQIRAEEINSSAISIVYETPIWADGFFTTTIMFYDTEIANSLNSLNYNNVVNFCYSIYADFSDQACQNIVRDPVTGRIQSVKTSLVNAGRDTVSGLDYQLRLDQDALIFGKPWHFTYDLQAHQLLERTTTRVSSFATTNRFDYTTFENVLGQFGYPEWGAQIRIAANHENFMAAWHTRFTGAVDDTDLFSTTGGVGRSDTCGYELICMDVRSAEEYFVHDISLDWDYDTWHAGVGISNIFDRDPPLVDGDAVLAFNNVPIGNGYDVGGRQYYFELRKRF